MFGIDDIVGAFTGGSGGSASSSVEVKGLDKMTLTLQGGEKPLAVSEVIELKPVTLTENVNLGGTDKPVGIWTAAAASSWQSRAARVSRPNLDTSTSRIPDTEREPAKIGSPGCFRVSPSAPVTGRSSTTLTFW